MANTCSVSGVVLLDTNVWMDYFTNRRGTAHELGRIFVAAENSSVSFVSSIMSTRDVFFLMYRFLTRRAIREELEQGAPARRQIAWACVKEMRNRSTIVGADLSDLIEAECLRTTHDDFEDNLILAAAKRAGATILITEDEHLRAHAPLSSYGIHEFAEMLGREDA